MPRVDNKGVSIHYRVEGDGPPLVIGHGITSSSDFWYERGFVAALKPKYRLVMIDARGHGQSDKPHDPQSYTTEKYASDIVPWPRSGSGTAGSASRPEVARHVLAESARVMRRGGLLLIFSPGRFNKAIRRNSPACETWGRLYTPSEMRALVTSAGFRNFMPLDAPRELLGKNGAGRLPMRAAFRLTRWDRLSATANCQASKQ